MRRACADVRTIIREKLGIRADAAAIVIAQRVSQSQYEQDYHLDRHAIRNLRVAHVDKLWRKAIRDVDSVLAMVRLHCSAIDR